MDGVRDVLIGVLLVVALALGWGQWRAGRQWEALNDTLTTLSTEQDDALRKIGEQLDASDGRLAALETNLTTLSLGNKDLRQALAGNDAEIVRFAVRIENLENGLRLVLGPSSGSLAQMSDTGEPAERPELPGFEEMQDLFKSGKGLSSAFPKRRVESEAELEQLYGDLLDDLGLSAEEEAKLRILLRLGSEDDIKNTLGEEQYGTYQQYEGTMPARKMIRDFESDLTKDAAGAALAPEKRRELIETLHQVAADSADQEVFSSGVMFQFNGETSVENQIEVAMFETDQTYDLMREEADELLTDSEAAAFDAFLDRRLEEKRKALESLSKGGLPRFGISIPPGGVSQFDTFTNLDGAQTTPQSSPGDKKDE